MSALVVNLCQYVLLVFLVLLMTVSARARGLFSGRYGRSHRLFGLALLCSHAMGGIFVAWSPSPTLASCAAYDVLLGVLGLGTTMRAAADFKRAHAAVRNTASGTLEPEATVTHDEMVEHAFYQGLNLVQALTMCAMEVASSAAARSVLLLLVTAPWLRRRAFPVNRFSDNYSRGQDPWALVPAMYRIKKWQYLLYKHALLHGLNVSVALSPGLRLYRSRAWRLYWLCLNMAYVHEFFLQTLVKRRYIEQRTMLALQALLMFASSGAALLLLRHVFALAAATSLLLNLVHRHHEMVNTAAVYACTLLWLVVRDAA